MVFQNKKFVRENKDLREWIRNLVCEDKQTRDKAAKVIWAMQTGIPDVEADLRDSKIDNEASSLFPQAVREVFSSNGFPAAKVVCGLINYYADPYRVYQENLHQTLKQGGDISKINKDFLDDFLYLHGLEILGNIGPSASGAIEQLIGLLNHDSRDELLSETAAKALGSMGIIAKPAFGPLFKKMCKSQNPYFYSKAIAQIIKEDEDMVKEVITYLSEKDISKIKAAINILLNLNTKDSIGRLKQLVNHEDEEIRGLVICEFGNVGKENSEIIEILLDRIENESGHNKSVAIEALAKTCTEPDVVVPILINALSDEDYSFCEYEGCVKTVTYYLGELVDKSESMEKFEAALPGLLEDVGLIEDYDDDDIGRIKLLGKFGEKAKSALPTLKKMYKLFVEDDPPDDGHIADELKKAIDNIG